jgi:hypothetical protein
MDKDVFQTAQHDPAKAPAHFASGELAVTGILLLAQVEPFMTRLWITGVELHFGEAAVAAVACTLERLSLAPLPVSVVANGAVVTNGAAVTNGPAVADGFDVARGTPSPMVSTSPGVPLSSGRPASLEPGDAVWGTSRKGPRGGSGGAPEHPTKNKSIN